MDIKLQRMIQPWHIAAAAGFIVLVVVILATTRNDPDYDVEQILPDEEEPAPQLLHIPEIYWGKGFLGKDVVRGTLTISLPDAKYECTSYVDGMEQLVKGHTEGSDTLLRKLRPGDNPVIFFEPAYNERLDQDTQHEFTVCCIAEVQACITATLEAR